MANTKLDPNMAALAARTAEAFRSEAAARIYTPCTDKTCMVCGRPAGEHARQPWGRPCPSVDIARERNEAETVADEQPATVL